MDENMDLGPFVPPLPAQRPAPAVDVKLEEEELSLPLRLAGALLDFGLFFGLCLALAARGWLLPPLTAPALPTFALVAFGLVFIITKSTVALPFSQLAGKLPLVGPALYSKTTSNGVEKEEGLLTCPLCTGMWVGAILAAVGVTAWPPAGGLLAARDLVAHGLLGAGGAYTLSAVVERLHR